jgi:CO/xanthine dehydrogenase Mo-binding subunit
VSPERLVAENGTIRDPSTDRSFRYGELAGDAARIPAPDDVPLKSPSEFKQIGRSFPRLDAKVKATGRAQFGIDAQVPGLLTAVVVHSPHQRGVLVSFDDVKTRAVLGVEDVFEISTGVAVVATSYWRARKGANALEVTWDPGESRGVSSDFIRREQKRRLDEESGKTVRDDGDVGDAFEAAAKVIEAEYYAPYLAHATMEPMNCTVVPSEGRCDVYIGTQAPDIAQEWVARNMDCPREEVFVHNAFLGGGFGRRGFSDYAGEAAEIAKQTGKPIKLVWSREDDMTQDYYRPASTHRLRAGFDEGGNVTAWEHRLVIPAIFPYVTDGSLSTLAPEWLRGVANSLGQGVVNLAVRYMGPMSAREGAADLPYRIENVRFETQGWDPGIPVGFWRSVGHSHNGFVVEGFIDEIAHAAGRDPAEFRRELLSEHPRHLAVLDLALEKSIWGSPPEGRYQGLAVHESFESVVAEVAEVSVENDQIRVHRVTCAVDCGIAVNPDIVRAQMESGIIYGLTAALKGEITFEDGAAVQTNFHDYPMLRMNETPAIDVHIVPSDAPPTGVGEPGTPPIGPAVANAIYAATGVRLRELPLRLV